MVEFIDREKAISIIEDMQKALLPVGRYGRNYIYGSEREKYDAWDEIIEALERIPEADVAPVVHGKWEYKEEWGRHVTYTCSICGQTLTTKHGRNGNYCPNCGAKMDLEG